MKSKLVPSSRWLGPGPEGAIDTPRVPTERETERLEDTQRICDRQAVVRDGHPAGLASIDPSSTISRRFCTQPPQWTTSLNRLRSSGKSCPE